jgi:hypothetical protein
MGADCVLPESGGGCCGLELQEGTSGDGSLTTRQHFCNTSGV